MKCEGGLRNRRKLVELFLLVFIKISVFDKVSSLIKLNGRNTSIPQYLSNFNFIQ